MNKYHFVAILVIALLPVVFLYQKYGNTVLHQKGTFADTAIDLSVSGGLSQEVFPTIVGGTDIQLSDAVIGPGAILPISSGILSTSVREHRVGTPGWNQTVSFTHFLNGSGPGTITVDNLTITPQNLQPGGASSTTNVTLGPLHTFINEADIALIMQAAPGFGRGRYYADTLLELEIPITTPIGSYASEATVTIV